jgi:hypothetical protein
VRQKRSIKLDWEKEPRRLGSDGAGRSAAEEYRIPSPRLSVRQVGDALDPNIEFRSEEDGALMRRVVPRLAIEPSLPKLALSRYRFFPLRAVRQKVNDV